MLNKDLIINEFNEKQTRIGIVPNWIFDDGLNKDVLLLILPLIERVIRSTSTEINVIVANQSGEYLYPMYSILEFNESELLKIYKRKYYDILSLFSVDGIRNNIMHGGKNEFLVSNEQLKHIQDILLFVMNIRTNL